MDSANLYWDQLVGPKYLLYLPNDEHGISDYRRLIPSLRALHAAAGSGDPLPALDWEYRWSEEGVALCVSAHPPANAVRFWRATSATRDFRDAVWVAEASSARGGVSAVATRRPQQGYVAVFGEMEFGRGSRAYSFSTNLAILSAQSSDGGWPQPTGHRGVCAAE